MFICAHLWFATYFLICVSGTHPLFDRAIYLDLCRAILSLPGKIDNLKIYAFFSMVEGRKTMHRGVMQKYGSYPIFLKNYIPYSAEIEKMGLYRKPLGASGSSFSVGNTAYRKLWSEIEQRRLA